MIGPPEPKEIHRGHEKPVFGCSECIKVRGKLYTSVTGAIHDLKREFHIINLRLERKITDSDEELVFSFLEKLERFVENLHYK